MGLKLARASASRSVRSRVIIESAFKALGAGRIWVLTRGRLRNGATSARQATDRPRNAPAKCRTTARRLNPADQRGQDFLTPLAHVVTDDLIVRQAFRHEAREFFAHLRGFAACIRRCACGRTSRMQTISV